MGLFGMGYPVAYANPTPVAQANEALVIKGYGSAHFGQKETKVIDSITQDFNISKDQIVKFSSSTSGNHILEISVDSFTPLNRPAKISYVLGAGKRQLVQINIDVTEPSNDRAKQIDFITKSISLVRSYDAVDLSENIVIDGKVTTNGIILKAIIDKDPAKQSALEMVLINVDSVVENKILKLSGKKDNDTPIVFRLNYLGNFKKPTELTP